jgi:hypothetical protein
VFSSKNFKKENKIVNREEWRSANNYEKIPNVY